MVNPNDDDNLKDTLEKISQRVSQSLHSAVAGTIEEHLNEFIKQAVAETEFYKKMTQDMRAGLKKIYNDVQSSSKDDEGLQDSKMKADKLFNEASEQLQSVLKDTENATENIMKLIEKHLNNQGETKDLLRRDPTDETMSTLLAINEEVEEDLTHILTLLSFQDLTGQRIKKVVTAVQQIETMVLDLYLASGLIMKAYEEAPDVDMDKLEKETREKVDNITQKVVNSELKGPTEGTNQADIDALLAQLM